jgi:cyanophycin synthetase
MPIVGVAGKRGTTLIARLIAWMLQISGKQVGLTCHDGLYLNSRQIPPGNYSHWEAGQRLLLNRTVEAAVFENSSRMILSEGLAYDKCAVGVVTDVSGHEELGEFYIHSADQLYQVLRTQIDVILPNGVAVLNAADPQLVEMAQLCDGEVIFYGLDAQLEAIAAHREQGGRVVFLRNSSIVLAAGQQETALLPLSSLKPAKAAQPEAVLAAVAAGWALGLAPELIGAGLRTFDSNPKKTHY